MTGLRYFCMRDFEEDVATQSFMRFLTEEKVTALLAVETAGEAGGAPGALLARGGLGLRVRDRPRLEQRRPRRSSERGDPAAADGGELGGLGDLRGRRRR